MRTIIIYTSWHGTTEKIAMRIQSELSEPCDLFDLKKQKKPNLSQYDKIIMGTSIHAGKIPRKMTKFIKQHIEMLSNKEIGLYLCCMEKGEAAQKLLEINIPAKLIQHARAIGICGGEFIFEKMNFIEKFMIKKISKIDQSISALNEQEIEKFIKLMNP